MSSIVSDEALATAMFTYSKILSPSLQVLAILANIFNIVTFCKIGLKDSVNVTFLAIAVSDVVYVVMDAFISASVVIALSPWQRDLPVGMLSLSGCVHFYQFVFLDSSTCLETYLAITRCCCVALPLKFKNMFTVTRTLIIIIIIFTCNLFLRVPLFSSYGLAWLKSSTTNMTKLSFVSQKDFQTFNMVEQVGARTVCPVIFLFISTLCSFLLTKSLVAASLRRKLMTQCDSLVNNNASEKSQINEPITTKTLSAKEVQLVKAVTLVIFLLGNVLLVLSVFSLAQAAVAEFYPGKKYKNLHGVVTYAVNLLLISHAGYKSIIYYKFNTKYRSTVNALLRLDSKLH
ncbi:5-hydroxytryptamine receptor 2 [Biomphalaria glabrata]|nr:5-hydroxytryptamine receptor 2-like [Biomphalaria glabrata]